jgi:putative addiction module component (TIGR02574 family)
MSLAQARAVALALPPDDRLALALELLESAEPEDDGVEAAWEAEIGRRVERLDRGEVQLLPTADVLRRIGR